MRPSGLRMRTEVAHVKHRPTHHRGARQPFARHRRGCRPRNCLRSHSSEVESERPSSVNDDRPSIPSPRVRSCHFPRPSTVEHPHHTLKPQETHVRPCLGAACPTGAADRRSQPEPDRRTGCAPSPVVVVRTQRAKVAHCAPRCRQSGERASAATRPGCISQSPSREFRFATTEGE